MFHQTFVTCLLLYLLTQPGLGLPDIENYEITIPVPDSSELAPMVLTVKPQVYNRDNLWEYINGAAPAYVHYSFQQVVTFVVTNPDSAEAVVDIYNMGDSLNAFGMFARERSPNGEALFLGSGAVGYSNSLYFWQDCYYIKLVAYSTSRHIPVFLTRLGELISTRLPVRGSLPQIFALFPTQDRVPDSEKYHPQDVLGLAFLNNGYSADYAAGNDKYSIFIIPCANEKDPGEKFALLQNAKSPSESVPKILNNYYTDVFIYKDSYYGSVTVARHNRYILAIAGALAPELAFRLLASFPTANDHR